MSIDVQRFFDDYSIDYSSAGKSASRGWTQITCPFDDCFDTSDHMGIHLKSGMYHCWLCDRKGPFTILVLKLLKISFRKAEEIVVQYEDDSFEPEDKEIIHSEKIQVKGLLNYLPEQHRQYLIDRNFDPDELIRKYQIGAFGTYGRFPYRISIPVFDDRQLVNITARDVTGVQERRYDSLLNEEAVVSIKSCVYNIDNCTKGSILIVEGPFDVWRMGGTTVCLFGTSFKTNQILRVLAKTPKNVFILFDKDADDHAEKLANNFSPFVKHVEVLNIEEKDPACLSPNDALNIRNELKL